MHILFQLIHLISILGQGTSTPFVPTSKTSGMTGITIFTPHPQLHILYLSPVVCNQTLRFNNMFTVKRRYLCGIVPRKVLIRMQLTPK